jgi:CxxC motif-containing protein
VTKRLVCIECPKGCAISVKTGKGVITAISGARCPKGLSYAAAEVENPVRILTSTVRSEGLSLRLVPVRTDRPVPKKDIGRAMKDIKKITVIRPVRPGDVLVQNLLGLGIRLIATREAGK